MTDKLLQELENIGKRWKERENPKIAKLENSLKEIGLTDEEIWDYRMAKFDEGRIDKAYSRNLTILCEDIRRDLDKNLKEANFIINKIEIRYSQARRIYEEYLKKD